MQVYVMSLCVRVCVCEMHLDEGWRHNFKANRMSKSIYVYQYMWRFPIELSLGYLPTGLYISLVPSLSSGLKIIARGETGLQTHSPVGRCIKENPTYCVRVQFRCFPQRTLDTVGPPWTDRCNVLRLYILLCPENARQRESFVSMEICKGSKYGFMLRSGRTIKAPHSHASGGVQ